MTKPFIVFFFGSLSLVQFSFFAMEQFWSGLQDGLKISLGLDLKKARQDSAGARAKKQADAQEKRAREDADSDKSTSSFEQDSHESQGSEKQDHGKEKKSFEPTKKRSRRDGTYCPRVQFTPEQQQEIDRRIKEAELFSLMDKQ